MSAKMTPGLTQSQLICSTETERNCYRLYRQHRSTNNAAGLQATKHGRAPCLRNCLRFCFRKRSNMEQKEQAADLPPENARGGLRDLASKWFIETQVPFIVHNGLFPNWFLGFISRKDAEDILREKKLGCFLIRLSDKALGYILSYKGRDRCRHFVINQSESGQFVVCGDSVGHATVSILIEHYKKNSIEPFGEYLTTSCFGALAEELYDTIQVTTKERPVATVHAVKHNAKKHSHTGSEQLLTRHRGKNKMQEEVPPLPRRSRLLENGSAANFSDKVFYAQVRKKQPKDRDQNDLATDNIVRLERIKDQNRAVCASASRPHSVYSEVELSDSRSRSLPLLVSSCEEQSYRLSVVSQTPPRRSPSPIRQTGSPVIEISSHSRPYSSHSLDFMSDTYHLAGERGQHSDVYAEVHRDGLTDPSVMDDTYEQIPDHTNTAGATGSVYEPVDERRPRDSPSPWGLKNDKWKRLFPDVKRKW